MILHENPFCLYSPMVVKSATYVPKYVPSRFCLDFGAEKAKSRPVNQSAKSEQTREKRRKAKKNGDLTISVFWSEWQDLNLRPLPPQLTWVCPLVRFACFHAVSAPRHLLLGHFSSTVSACSAFVCGKNCGQPAFCADSGRGFVGRKKNRVFSAALKNL